MSEFESEPVPGLPERLPQGEILLWQGSPVWFALARRALHVTAALLYVGLAVLWSLIASTSDGQSWPLAVASAARVSAVGLIGVGLLVLLGWKISRAAIYTVTNRRVVMRFGVALPMAVNLPFSRIGSADLKLYADGTGDIALTMTGDTRLGFVPLWPHVRPWRLTKPQPMLRCVPDARKVAAILSNELASAHGTSPKPVSVPQASSSPAAPPIRDNHPTPVAA